MIEAHPFVESGYNKDFCATCGFRCDVTWIHPDKRQVPIAATRRRAEEWIRHTAWIGKHNKPWEVGSEAAGIMRVLLDEHADMLDALQTLADDYERICGDGVELNPPPALKTALVAIAKTKGN